MAPRQQKVASPTASAAEALHEKEMALIAQYGPDDKAAFITLALGLAIWGGLVMVAPTTLSWSSFFWFFLAGCTRTRLFMTFHDCGHNSYFTDAERNKWYGTLLEMYIFTPLSVWKRGHNRHHAVQGNLDVYDEAATIAHTTEDWRGLPAWKRVGLRVARDPILFFFALLPLGMWCILFPFSPEATWRSRFSNFIQAAILCVAFWVRGSPQGYLYCLLLEFFTMWVAAILGCLLFHLQHSVNEGYRASNEKFVPRDAALHGSTYTIVPFWMKWVTLGIEYHHIHHLSTRVPSYRLRACHEAGEKMGLWKEVTTVSYSKGLASFFNVLWDKEQEAYVSFWPYNYVAEACGEKYALYEPVFTPAATKTA